MAATVQLPQSPSFGISPCQISEPISYFDAFLAELGPLTDSLQLPWNEPIDIGTPRSAGRGKGAAVDLGIDATLDTNTNALGDVFTFCANKWDKSPIDKPFPISDVVPTTASTAEGWSYFAIPTVSAVTALFSAVATPQTPLFTLKQPPLRQKRLSTPVVESSHSVVATSTAEVRDQVTSHSKKKRKIEDAKQPNPIRWVGADGIVVGTESVLGEGRAIRQPYSVDERKRTAATRRRGACEECKKNKKRCDRPESPYECCENCKTKLLVMPCFMAKIADAVLFRDKPSSQHPGSTLRSSIFASSSDFVSQPSLVVPVTLTQDSGINLSLYLTLYEPQPGEVTHRVWHDNYGTKHTISLPPYCIANAAYAEQAMLHYITSFRNSFIDEIITFGDPVISSIFALSQHFDAAHPNSLVSHALDLCVAGRVIERDWHFVSGHQECDIPILTPSTPPYFKAVDVSCPFFGRAPIPPLLDAQLDQIVIRTFLRRTRFTLLTKLAGRLSRQPAREEHMELLLSVALLLAHAEFLLQHSRRMALRVGARNRYVSMSRAENYFVAANTVLCWWHRASRGLGLGVLSDFSSVEEEMGEETSWTTRLRQDLERRQIEIESLRKDKRYETSLFWVGQMFEKAWRAEGAVREVSNMNV